MERSIKNKSSYQLLIIDLFAFALLGLCAGLVDMRVLGVSLSQNETLLVGLAVPVFFFLMTGLMLYLLAEHKFNHLKLKNIFLYFALIIALVNIIAISTLPSVVTLPNGASLEISPLMRTYYLLSGFGFGLVPYFCFYLVPRKILNRHYMDIILTIFVFVVVGLILISFIVEWDKYVGMFNNHFVDIEGYALQSICGHKNDFGRMLLFGIFATILLRISKKDARWSLFLIPFYLFILLTFSKMSMFIATLTVLTYLIVRIVMIAKKSKDNLVITSLIAGFVLLLMPLFIFGIVRSDAGILFNIKNAFIKLGDSAKRTFDSRLIIWDCAFDILKPYQYIFGFGINSFDIALHNTYAMVAPTWDVPNLPYIYQAHNIFIEFIGQGGIILLGIYLFLYGYLIYVALKLRKKTPWLSFATIFFLITTLIDGVVEPVYICGIMNKNLLLNFVVVFPIMSEYYLSIDKDEKEIRKEIISQSKSIKKINFNNKLLELNKKRLIYEAKYIAYDLNSKIRL